MTAATLAEQNLGKAERLGRVYAARFGLDREETQGQARLVLWQAALRYSANGTGGAAGFPAYLEGAMRRGLTRVFRDECAQKRGGRGARSDRRGQAVHGIKTVSLQGIRSDDESEEWQPADPFDAITAADDRLTVLAELRTMHPSRADVLLREHVLEQDQRQIAAAIGCSQMHVSRISRGAVFHRYKAAA